MSSHGIFFLEAAACRNLAFDFARVVRTAPYSLEESAAEQQAAGGQALEAAYWTWQPRPVRVCGKAAAQSSPPATKHPAPGRKYGGCA